MIHPSKFSQGTLQFIFNICKRFVFLQWYWRKRINYFSGSQYSCYLLHKDGTFQKCDIVYYDRNTNIATITLYKDDIYDRNTCKYIEVKFDYLRLNKKNK